MFFKIYGSGSVNPTTEFDGQPGNWDGYMIVNNYNGLACSTSNWVDGSYIPFKFGTCTNLGGSKSIYVDSSSQLNIFMNDARCSGPVTSSATINWGGNYCYNYNSFVPFKTKTSGSVSGNIIKNEESKVVPMWWTTAALIALLFD
ncbi:hypothetical protein HDU79_004697 [Rhizoclosmatium sp. JEL0117]|nr:hypothetical protein HDU79_004697 [Rhizoclosmatium sp. JEL0117]